MKIHKFDINKGIYQFELNELETTVHSHPAFEIIFSKNRGIELEIGNTTYLNASFVILEPNTLHKVKYNEANVLVVMMECNTVFLQKFLSKFDINLSKGVYVEKEVKDRTVLIQELIDTFYHSKLSMATDERIQQCLEHLNSSSSTYTTLIEDLKSKTYLSDSRLSHLFKQELGISIKKYYVWSNLKKAFKAVIYDEKNMYQAAIENGFYDQAHLSKAFKQMLGITPSDVYNSRTLQVK